MSNNVVMRRLVGLLDQRNAELAAWMTAVQTVRASGDPGAERACIEIERLAAELAADVTPPWRAGKETA